MHIPIGIANTVDTLKTFVEAEGNFSPGVGSYGVYFWVFDKRSGELAAPTMEAIECEHGLADGRYLIPWSKWSAGNVTVQSEICEVKWKSSEGHVFIVGSRVTLANAPHERKSLALYATLRPLGPAGFDVCEIAVSKEGDALLVDGHAAIVAAQKPSGAGVAASDTVGEFALSGRIPEDKYARSENGNCSGALRFDIELAPAESRTFGFICPVLPGRRAVGHQWDGVSEWAQFDLAELNPSSGGVLQPDPGLDYYQSINVASLFLEAQDYWRRIVDKVTLNLPDDRWEGAFAAIIAHAALEMNEGAPDVAVVNYNVFNRDGVYVANIFQKSGNIDLAVEAIDYFTEHPFNGRSYPEADNPGQILWAMGRQWRFTHDRAWAEHIYPAARKIAKMIEYYRTTEGPHWISMDGIGFGPELPEEKRRRLKPGRCDGHHPEYTEAFDIAGLRAAAMLAEAVGDSSGATKWTELAKHLLEIYDRKFGKNLGKGYGSYSVLWPCRLYPLDAGKGHEHFKNNAEQKPGGWRYFPLAKAHQGLLAGNREAGYGTLRTHLKHPQMRGWYAFDEGGKSGSGGWRRVRTTWDGNVAMPHGWAIAELWLLLRDCLVFENEGRLILLSGIPPASFTRPERIGIGNLPTHFGKLNLKWERIQGGALLRLNGQAKPPRGFVLRLPPALGATVAVNGTTVASTAAGEFVLPPKTTRARVRFNGRDISSN
jgi:hypothetical protein